MRRNEARTFRSPATRAWISGLVLLVAGCGDDSTGPAEPPAVDSPEAVIGALTDAYMSRDISRLDRLLAQEPGAEYLFHLAEPLPSGRTDWDAGSELYIHRRMFRPDNAVPRELWLDGITMSATPVTPFAEIANPPGLDAGRWRTFEATYQTEALFDTQGDTDYRVEIPAAFQVIEDLAKQSGDEGKYLLYSWRDVLPEIGGTSTSVRSPTWGMIKHLFAGGNAPATPAALVEALRTAYTARDYDRYAAIFPAGPEGAQFRFVLPDPLPDGQAFWGLSEELRIHRRMFRPDVVPAGETPVPQQYWLSSITISLTPLSSFTEVAAPEGLDPQRWRTWQAEYQADVLFDTQGDIDYRVWGKQHFVVAELRHRLEGVPGRECLYRWQELGGYIQRAVEQKSWANLKSLYR